MNIKIVALAKQNKKQNKEFKNVEYGYIHNGNINEFNFEKAIDKFFKELIATENYAYVRITNVEIDLNFTYPTYEE